MILTRCISPNARRIWTRRVDFGEEKRLGQLGFGDPKYLRRCEVPRDYGELCYAYHHNRLWHHFPFPGKCRRLLYSRSLRLSNHMFSPSRISHGRGNMST
jgi:hypothetical protein